MSGKINYWEQELFVTILDRDSLTFTFLCLTVILTARRYVVRHVGDMYELGADIGKYYSVNVPLREGIDDHCKSYTYHLCVKCYSVM